eukprot:1176964-Prorocentrum_minimum.AAC.1
MAVVNILQMTRARVIKLRPYRVRRKRGKRTAVRTQLPAPPAVGIRELEDNRDVRDLHLILTGRRSDESE